MRDGAAGDRLRGTDGQRAEKSLRVEGDAWSGWPDLCLCFAEGEVDTEELLQRIQQRLQQQRTGDAAVKMETNLLPEQSAPQGLCR